MNSAVNAVKDASFSEGSGDLIFICQLNEDRVFHGVRPAVGRLVIFPANMPHMTEKTPRSHPVVSGVLILSRQSTIFGDIRVQDSCKFARQTVFHRVTPQAGTNQGKRLWRRWPVLASDAGRF